MAANNAPADGARNTADLVRELERYLHEQIPLSAAMQVSVERASPAHVVLAAPFGPNINHQRTVFGGSAAVLATLAAWSLLHLKLRQAELPAQLVIQRSAMKYLHSMAGDFTASCGQPEESTWSRFEQTLRRRGRARLQLSSLLLHAGRVCAQFEGDFVALPWQ
jgi:thioesterase domain-containing protein